MIQVISCHHFVSQEVFQSEAEPEAFCCSQGKIFIATDENCINLHNLDSRGNVLHSFSSIDLVSQIIYCNSGNYIAALEKKITKHSTAVTYVRVYFNWWIDSRGQPIKVRKAGTSHAPSSELWNDHFQVLELPLNKTALCIACCKTTAALGISLGNTISVFCYNAKTLDVSKHHQHDFSHFIDVEINFIVQELNMCKNYFACMSTHQVQVFKVSIEREDALDITEPTKETGSKPTSDSLDRHFVEWQFESCTGASWENDLKKCVHPDSFPVTVNFRGIEKENCNCTSLQNCEIFGPILTVKGYKIKVKLDPIAFDLWPTLSSTNIDAVTLLYREFAFEEKDASLMSLHLVSFYESDNYDQQLDPLHAAAVASQESFSSLPWSSSNLDARPQLKAIGCFFSTVREGFLYDVTEETRQIGTYSYTSNLKSAVLDMVFLHALTDAGLETYTLHLSHCAFQYVENLDGITNACPDFNSPVCLLGLRPFLGASKLVMSENHLVVVSSLEESERVSDPDDGRSCTLYILRKPSPQQIFSDLLEMGQMYKVSSPSTYHLILKESHMILRTHLYLCRNYDPDAEELYLKSCILLGDYYTCSSTSSDKALATPYYNLAKLSVEEVIHRVLGFQNQFKHCKVLKALVVYLNSALLDRHCNTTESFPKAMAENILDVYLEESPENLWKIILCSGMISYKIEKAMLMLKRRITSKRLHSQTGASIAGDTIAIVHLLLRKGNVDAAHNMYLSILKADLATIITDLHTLLWSENGLTSLGKFTRQIRPDAFVEMLLRLVKAGNTMVADVIEMLKLNETAVEVYNVPQLKEFLEAVWNDCEAQSLLDTTCQVLLVDIYLNRLLETSTTLLPTAKPSFTWGSRHQWLNEMPPFNGKCVTKNCVSSPKEDKRSVPVSDTNCCCVSCNEDLLKLQCFLIHRNASKELGEHVLEFLKSSSIPVRGGLSLEVLSLSEDQAVARLLDSCPSALFQYASDTFNNDQAKWCDMFTMLLKKKDDVLEDDINYQVYSQTFHKVLSHLSEILSVPSLLSLLPSEKAEEMFLPYVKRCCEKQQSRQLKNKIVALGNEIKAMM